MGTHIPWKDHAWVSIPKGPASFSRKPTTIIKEATQYLQYNCLCRWVTRMVWGILRARIYINWYSIGGDEQNFKTLEDRHPFCEFIHKTHNRRGEYSRRKFWDGSRK